MSAPFEPRLWGKERGLTHPYPLGCHAIDAAVMAAALWDRYLTPRQRAVIVDGWGLTEPEARTFVICLAALHDLGKITPSFQSCVPSADQLTGQPGYEPSPVTASSPSHQRATHLVLPELLHRLHCLPITGRPTRSLAHQIGQLLGGHHGTYPIALSHQGNELTCPLTAAPGLGEKAWDEQREYLIHLIYDLFGTPAWPGHPPTGPAAVITTGLVILADWLVSQLPWIRARQKRWDRDHTHNWQAHVRRARRAAPKTLREAQLTPPTWRRTRTFHKLFPHLSGKTLHPLQSNLAQSLPTLAKSSPGLLLITAPPGEGKTEAALFAERIMGPAAGTKGLAFLLPTMATTDAMWARIRAYARANCRTPPPITLLHAMAWLDADYTPDQLATATNNPDVVAEWLRGRHRGFLAGIAVGTWDQAALAVLPHRFMALRWLGLSGKTIVIDEVHAYDAHGHALTLRLLEWLGALGVPVILLSATVTDDTAAALIHAYRCGAGHHDTPDINPSYPGWTYTDHATGTINTSPTVSSNRAHALTINSITCTHTHNPDHERGRARAVLGLLTPLEQAHAGCALIICNTVADAQATRDLLDNTWATGTDRPLVRILHARMPARQRTAITRRIQRWTGPHGKRPSRPFVVITTQVAEQSLDVDFDLVISDMAPIALLLQRAGRGHRHPRTDRPTWATQARLAVLIPGGQLPPPAWGDVYSASLLRRTRDLLASLKGEPVNVPRDVQRLVDQVYGPEFANADDTDRLADDMQRTATAHLTAIPTPTSVRDLHPLTNTDENPDKIATRLGADSIRILPTYLTPDGHHWLHPTHHSPRTALPQRIHPNDRPTIRRLMQASIPINSQWLTGRGPATNIPGSWSDIPGLRDLILLPHTVTPATISPYRAAGRAISLDLQNGLLRH